MNVYKIFNVLLEFLNCLKLKYFIYKLHLFSILSSSTPNK